MGSCCLNTISHLKSSRVGVVIAVTVQEVYEQQGFFFVAVLLDSWPDKKKYLKKKSLPH